MELMKNDTGEFKYLEISFRGMTLQLQGLDIIVNKPSGNYRVIWKRVTLWRSQIVNGHLWLV